MLKEIRTLLLPTKSELFLYPAIALLLLTFQNISRYWSYFSGVKFEDVKNASNLGSQIEYWVLDNESKIDPRIADFIVWVLLGMAVISVILFIVNNVRKAKEEQDLLHYVQNPLTKRHELEAFSLKIAIRITAVISFLVYLRIFFGSINVALCSLFFVSSLSLNNLTSLLWLVACIVLFALAAYAFTIFARIITLKSRVF